MRKQSGGDPHRLHQSFPYRETDAEFHFPLSLILSDTQHSARASPNTTRGCPNKTQDAVFPFTAMENHTTHEILSCLVDDARNE